MGADSRKYIQGKAALCAGVSGLPRPPELPPHGAALCAGGSGPLYGPWARRYQGCPMRRGFRVTWQPSGSHPSGLPRERVPPADVHTRLSLSRAASREGACAMDLRVARHCGTPRPCVRSPGVKAPVRQLPPAATTLVPRRTHVRPDASTHASHHPRVPLSNAAAQGQTANASHHPRVPHQPHPHATAPTPPQPGPACSAGVPVRRAGLR